MTENPLKKFYRQPKIYIKLPSSGNFYPPESIDMPPTGEFPIFAMTAKDELLMKTPDALMNGQATVDVIQSCVPNIKNAWDVPSIDVDAILVAIRIATYGEMLDVTAYVPGLDETKSYETDLTSVLDHLLHATYESEVVIDDDLTIYLRPLTYREFSSHSLKTLEEQRLLRVVTDESIDEVRKLELFSQSFKKLTDLTVNTVSMSVAKVLTPDDVVTNSGFIQEFIDNADKDFFKKVVDHLEEQKEKFTIKPFKVKFTAEEVAHGAPEEMEVPITLDGSNFFG
jgi:hypothetical protein